MGYQKDLTRRQQQVLDYVRSEVHKKGYPPSVREIGEALGLSSSSTVHSHLAALEAKGYIRRDPTKPRALEIFDYRDGDIGFEVGAVSAVPVVGQVAAGMPILAAENIEQTLPLPTEFSGDQTFILRVKGESMIEAGILPGDFVVVRQQETATNGDIVVAMIEDEATIKTYYRETDRIRLQPQNSSMEPIYSTDVTILGKAVALFRRI